MRALVCAAAGHAETAQSAASPAAASSFRIPLIRLNIPLETTSTVSGRGEFGDKRVAPIDLDERLGHGGGRDRNRAVQLRVEEIFTTQRMDVAVENGADHLALGVDQWGARIAADDVVVGRDVEHGLVVDLALGLDPARRELERRLAC